MADNAQMRGSITRLLQSLPPGGSGMGPPPLIGPEGGPRQGLPQPPVKGPPPPPPPPETPEQRADRIIANMRQILREHAANRARNVDRATGRFIPLAPIEPAPAAQPPVAGQATNTINTLNQIGPATPPPPPTPEQTTGTRRGVQLPPVSPLSYAIVIIRSILSRSPVPLAVAAGTRVLYEIGKTVIKDASSGRPADVTGPPNLGPLPFPIGPPATDAEREQHKRTREEINRQIQENIRQQTLKKAALSKSRMIGILEWTDP